MLHSPESDILPIDSSVHMKISFVREPCVVEYTFLIHVAEVMNCMLFLFLFSEFMLHRDFIRKQADLHPEFVKQSNMKFLIVCSCSH